MRRFHHLCNFLQQRFDHLFAARFRQVRAQAWSHRDRIHMEPTRVQLLVLRVRANHRALQNQMHEFLRSRLLRLQLFQLMDSHFDPSLAECVQLRRFLEVRNYVWRKHWQRLHPQDQPSNPQLEELPRATWVAFRWVGQANKKRSPDQLLRSIPVQFHLNLRCIWHQRDKVLASHSSEASVALAPQIVFAKTRVHLHLRPMRLHQAHQPKPRGSDHHLLVQVRL